MTVRKLLKKYEGLQKQGYETIFIVTVIQDLYQIVRNYDARKATMEGRKR